MREHDVQSILKWIGFKPGMVVTEQMIRDAIKYAFDMGYTDGSQ